MTESEFRDFMREQTLRRERASREMQRGLRALERRTDEMVRRSDVQIETLRELVEEARAQRKGLLAAIDRLGPGPASA